MLDKRLNMLNGMKLACAVLGLLLIVQIGSALSGDGSSGGLDPEGLPGRIASPPPESSDAESDPAKKPAVKLPEVYRPIVDRYVFGKKPPRPPQPIVLEGIAHRSVFLQTPKGRSVIAKVGDTVDGVKVLEIRQNRVLIEHQGEKKELVINEGLGSEPILPPAAKKVRGPVKPSTNPKHRAVQKPEGQEQKK